jgi:hypothetical protein
VRARWIAIALDDAGRARWRHVKHLDDLGDVLDGVLRLAIDISIGLPSTGRQQRDDAAARCLVGDATRCSTHWCARRSPPRPTPR